MHIVNNVKLKFMARSFTASYGMERMRVLVSTTGTNAPADFTAISVGTYIEVPAAWTQYSFDLSAYAGQEIHLAIQCVSYEAFFLMVDDISVDIDGGKQEPSKGFDGYTVYLDGVVQATSLTANSFTFTDLENGDRTAGVQTIYGTVASPIATLPFNVTGTPVKYMVAASSNNPLWGTVSGGGVYHELNDLVTVTATPNTGYQFVNWTENGVPVFNETEYSFIVTENRNLVAHFEVKTVIRYVKTTGTGDGSSWANASNDIQAMLNASAVGEQVWIAGGTYPLSTIITMEDGVNVYGGFEGTETSVTQRERGEYAWDFNHPTILDGQNATRVLTQGADNFTNKTTWDGVTITNGYNTTTGTTAAPTPAVTNLWLILKKVTPNPTSWCAPMAW